jgi:hypothetical protein
MEKNIKTIYEKPAVRELSPRGAFAIGTYTPRPVVVSLTDLLRQSQHRNK